MNTPSQAGFARFVTEISDVKIAVMEKHKELEGEGIVQGKMKTEDQIYYCIAAGKPLSQAPTTPTSSGDVTSLGAISPEGLKGTKIYHFTNGDLIPTNKTYYGEDEMHYLTNAGELFILPGYKVVDGSETKWYIDETHYYTGEARTLSSN